MTPTLITKINFGLMAVVCTGAMVRGDRSLRISAAAYAFAAAASEAFQDWNDTHKAQPYILMIDVAYTALLYAVLARTFTRWPKYAFVSMVLVVLTHLMANLDHGLTRWAFFSAYYVFSYAALGALAAGAILEPGGRPQKI